MKIGVDIDGVLADMVPVLMDFYNKKKGTKFTAKDQVEYYLDKVWGCSQEEATTHVMDFYASEEFDLIKPLAGAKKAIESLSKKHHLFAITARPDRTKEKTEKWINRYFSGKFKGVYFTNLFIADGVQRNKSDFCREIGVDYMIEDHLDYALDCASQEIKVLMLDYPYNKQKKLPKTIKRVKDWEEITQILLA